MEEESEVGRGGRVGKAGQRRAGECGVPRLPFLLLRLQPIAQRHQLVHLRHDPLLLGEGRKRDGERIRFLATRPGLRVPLPSSSCLNALENW